MSWFPDKDLIEEVAILKEIEPSIKDIIDTNRFTKINFLCCT